MTDPPKLRAVPAASAIAEFDLSRWEKNIEWAARDREVAEQRAREQSEADRAARIDRRADLVTAGWPLRALEAAEHADESNAAIVQVKAWDPTKVNVPVLSGPVGCGKTTAAAYWALRRKTAARFIRASSFARSSRYNEDERREWLASSALVLDDLGTEWADKGESFLVDLGELVDVFYGNRRPLLITTNLLAADFKRRYGDRITDRLREAGEWIGLNGESLRRKT